jgi:hypothetical protein
MNETLHAILIGALCGIPFAVIGALIANRILRRP